MPSAWPGHTALLLHLADADVHRRAITLIEQEYAEVESTMPTGYSV